MQHLGIWADPENVRRVVEWWKGGYSAPIIVEKFAEVGVTVTKNMVIGKVHRLKVERDGAAPHVVKVYSRHAPKERTERKFRYKIVGAKMKTNVDKDINISPSPDKRVLLKQTKDGQCRAILGYIDGKLSEAVCCGDDCRPTIKAGRVVHSSWCPYHHNIFTMQGRYESSSRTARKV